MRRVEQSVNVAAKVNERLVILAFSPPAEKSSPHDGHRYETWSINVMDPPLYSIVNSPTCLASLPSVQIGHFAPFSFMAPSQFVFSLKDVTTSLRGIIKSSGSVLIINLMYMLQPAKYVTYASCHLLGSW